MKEKARVSLLNDFFCYYCCCFYKWYAQIVKLLLRNLLFTNTKVDNLFYF